MHADRTIELFRECRFVRRAEVAAPLEGQSFLFQNADRVVVRETREGRLHLFEPGRVALERLQLPLSFVERAADNVGDEPFGQLHDIFKRGKRHLGLHHPELRQVAARLRLLRAKRRPEGIHAAERHRIGFVV